MPSHPPFLFDHEKQDTPMTYCRVSIEHTTRGRVYKKDFDPQHVFGPLVRAVCYDNARRWLALEGMERCEPPVLPRLGKKGSGLNGT